MGGAVNASNPEFSGYNSFTNAQSSYITNNSPFTATFSVYRNSATQVTVNSSFGAYTVPAYTINSDGGYSFDTAIISNFGASGTTGSALAASGGNYTLDNISVQIIK